MSKYQKYPIEEAINLKDGLNMIFTDHWWVVEDNCILISDGGPLCNSNKNITSRMANGKECRQLLRVFLPMYEVLGEGCGFNI